MASTNSDEAKRKELLDRYIRICSDMYLMGVSVEPSKRFEIFLGSDGEAKKAIEFIKSTYRKQEVIDTWNAHEIALFIAGTTRFGRDWQKLKSILPHKSASEMSQFYYSVWKGSAMAAACRKLRKQRGIDLVW